MAVVAIVADVLDTVEGSKRFNAVLHVVPPVSRMRALWARLETVTGGRLHAQVAGSIETLPAWRMWNDEVIAMGRHTEHGRGASSSYGVARRVELAKGALQALQAEIANCPPVAREIIGCRDMLLGIACALNIGDQQCMREACEVIIKCAQECASRAGDAIVGCPRLLNGLCRQAMQTEDPAVIDALTALSHQNDKMLWIVTTIIKVMRVERQCGVGLLRRSVKAWKSRASQPGMARTKTALLSATAISSSIDAAPVPTPVPALKVQSTRVCDVDDFYLQTISARSYLPDQGAAVDTPGQFLKVAKDSQVTRNRIRDDIIIEPSLSSGSFGTMQGSIDGATRPVGMQVSSIYSSWNTASTPLYSTFNGTGEVQKDAALVHQFGLVPESQPNSTSSSLSLPSPEDSCSTFRSPRSSVVVQKEDDHNPESIMAITDRLMSRSQQLNSEVQTLRSTRALALPEPKILPELLWTPQEGQNYTGVQTSQMVMPPDSLLFASQPSNVGPKLYGSFNGSNPQSAQNVPEIAMSWRGPEFSMSAGHKDFNSVRAPISQRIFVRGDESIHRGRAPSAPPRLDRAESISSIGAPVLREIAPARRALSPPRVLPPITVEPTRASQNPAAGIRGAATIQVPNHKAAPGSVCDVDHLFSYFSRGRTRTRDPPAPPATYTHTVRSISPNGREAVRMAPASEMIARPSSPLTTQSANVREASPNMRPISPNMRDASPQRQDSNQQFHKLADEIAFQHIGVGARMQRDASPQRDVPARDVRSPVTRSIVGASTIQIPNFSYAPQSAHTSIPLYSSTPQHSSSLRQSNVEMCDVDETPMQPAFVGYTSPAAKANDWVGVHVESSTVHAGRREIVLYSPRRAEAEEEDDWC